MALDPSTLFPTKIDTSSDPAGYPYGKPQNVSAPGDNTGTPWDEDVAGDLFGLFQAILDGSSTIPSGSPDKVGASQYLDGLRAILQPSTFYFGGSVSANDSAGAISSSSNYSVNTGGLGIGYQSSWDQSGGATTVSWATTFANIVANTGGSKIHKTKLVGSGTELLSGAASTEETLIRSMIEVDWIAGAVNGYVHFEGGIGGLYAHYRISGTPTTPVTTLLSGNIAVVSPSIVCDVANRRVTGFPETHQASNSDAVIDYEITEYK